MKKQKAPEEFGKRPILMMRCDGGLRIIHPNGEVEFVFHDTPFENICIPACTTRRNQKAAYRASVKYDRMQAFFEGDIYSYSQFLGYL